MSPTVLYFTFLPRMQMHPHAKGVKGWLPWL